MRKSLLLNVFLCFSAFALLPRAQAQPMFDVPFVPTPHVVIDEMLRLADVKPGDFVMDLGSGDGRVLITAAKKFGARGIGVDLDEQLIFQSEAAAEQAGVADRVKFLQQDLFKTDLTQATVITMYLLPGVMMRLRPQLFALRPGTRLVSHDFRLGDWSPDVTTQIRKNTFLWIVPAKVAGKWQMKIPLPGGDHAITLELRQKYQEIDGFAQIDGRHAQIWEPRLWGDRLSFVIVDDRDRDSEASLYFEGRVSGDVIAGRLRRGAGNAQTIHDWRAVRVAAQ
ncbi:MAG: methyltransferase domain-containing protein [Betaproteobacteria bacterium]|nr:MAG: methyltransferase domain-containing protein [Betaproteobacteria bacterium]